MGLEVRENDHISRSSILEKLDSFHPDYTFNIASFRNLIKAEPSAEKKGKWIEYDNSHCECPFCHEEWSYFEDEPHRFNFCPNCGADMRGEQE